MPKITVSIQKKRQFHKRFSSDGAGCTVEIDVPISTTEDFSARVSGLFRVAEAAVDAQLERTECAPPGPPTGPDLWACNAVAPEIGPPQEPAASSRQMEYLHKLAARAGLAGDEELAQWLKSELGTGLDLAGLSRSQASQTIDRLKQKGENGHDNADEGH